MNSHNDGERPLRVLHIEDSPRDAEIIRERLITAGFSLHLDWAANEQEFTSFLQGGGYDLVLADYQIPGFDAPAALKLTKSLCPGVPFICVSGAIGEDKAVELLKLGATDYVSKNRLDKLSLAIERTLNEHNERKARVQADAEKANLEAQLFQAQKMEAIGTLAGGVAHDFNNILAAIIGYTEMAMEESQNKIQSRYLQETLKGAERAKNLVKQILTFSRQDGHEKKPLDIMLLLKEAVKFLRASIPATIEIRQRLTDESCNILADPTQMHQIIMNLCTNAGHAMKQTGGVLTMELSTLELSPGEISRYPDLKPGSYVKLTVSDTGHGIDSALQLRIFDPFFTTKSKDEGTGLGLSVVYGIVKSHDGIITVYSEPGKGASFSVYLPMIIPEEITNRSVSKAVTGGTERILFVDDEPVLVDIGATMLSSLGYEVTGVTSSLEALNLFRAAPGSFDLVITDMTLPKMTGIDLSREIMQIRPGIPVILCSGIRDSETEKQVKSMGIRAYSIKPLTRRDLSRVIRETLDGDCKKH